MKIAINYKHCYHLHFVNLHNYGMRHTGQGLVMAGDYTQGSYNYYYVFDEKLFLNAVLKFGFEYKIRE
jgi:hypothetical protein